MTKKQIIAKTADYVKTTLSKDFSGHDWWHAYRVRKNAILIGKTEKADMFVVELAALLHDIADWKFHNGDEEIGPKTAATWLDKLNVPKPIIEHVKEIIRNISFKGAGILTPMKTIEGKIVQDADRLDALGAIGAGRTFAYGGTKGRAMYNPEVKTTKYKNFEEYKHSQSSSINHFYEKLLLLKDLMNTKTAKKIAQKRHRFLLVFLDEFLNEWHGKR